MVSSNKYQKVIMVDPKLHAVLKKIKGPYETWNQMLSSRCNVTKEMLDNLDPGILAAIERRDNAFRKKRKERINKLREREGIGS